MTFCVTWVVDRIVTTHFRKPLEGRASSRSRFTGEDDGENCSAFFSVSVDSNQNKQVIYVKSVFAVRERGFFINIPVQRIQLGFRHYYLS